MTSLAFGFHSDLSTKRSDTNKSADGARRQFGAGLRLAMSRTKRGSTANLKSAVTFYVPNAESSTIRYVSLFYPFYPLPSYPD